MDSSINTTTTTTTTTTSSSSSSSSVSLANPPLLPSSPLLPLKVHKRIIRQYASRVLFCSSQYDYPEYSHRKLLGKPTFFPGYGDCGKTWAPRLSKGRECFIVKFKRPVEVNEVRIFETNCPGAVVRIFAKKYSTKDDLKRVNSLRSTEMLEINTNQAKTLRKSIALGIRKRKRDEEDNNNNQNGINNNNNNDEDEDELDEDENEIDIDEEEEEGEGEEEPEEDENDEDDIYELDLDAPLSNEWELLWQMDKAPPQQSVARVFSPSLLSSPLTNIIRVDIDSTINTFRAWYEVDAVQLVGVALETMPPPSPHSIASDFGIMLDEELCCDTEIHFSDGQVMKAHAGVLAARCSIFRAMLTSGMKESATKKITISDISYDVMRLLIRYLYTGYVVIPPEYFVQLFYAADKYNLEPLMKMCEQDFALTIDEESVIPLYIAVWLWIIQALEKHVAIVSNQT